MVKLRLQRFGSKKRPYYRVVAAEATSPRDGRFIEIIGTYHPIDKENVIRIGLCQSIDIHAFNSIENLIFFNIIICI